MWPSHRPGGIHPPPSTVKRGVGPRVTRCARVYVIWPRYSTVGVPGKDNAETPRWGGCLPFWVGQASRPAIRRPHSPGPCPGTPLPPKGGPHRNPAKRLRWGEEEQGSAVGNARRAFPTERTLPLTCPYGAPAKARFRCCGERRGKGAQWGMPAGHSPRSGLYPDDGGSFRYSFPSSGVTPRRANSSSTVTNL